VYLETGEVQEEERMLRGGLVYFGSGHTDRRTKLCCLCLNLELSSCFQKGDAENGALFGT